MERRSTTAPKLVLPQDDSAVAAALRRGSLSARLTKASVGDKGNALEQLAQAAEAIRKQRGGGDPKPPLPPPRGHVRQRSLSASEIPDAVKRQMMRMKAEEELRVTEETYVRDLIFVKQRVIDPLERREILSRDEKAALFANLPQLLEMHQHLLADLRKSDKPWEPFKKLSAFFKLYISYSTAHASGSVLAEKLIKSNPAFAAFISEALEGAPGKLRLVDYLIKPVQRICKYPLLFNELQKFTDAPHCIAIGEVATKMAEVAKFVNSAQRRVETAPRLVEIAQTLDTNGKSSFTELIAPDRHFLREVLCEVVMEDGDSERLLVFLFSDMILLARPPSVLRKKYELRLEIPLTTTLKATLEDVKVGVVLREGTRTVCTMKGVAGEEAKEWIRQVESAVQLRAACCSPRQQPRQ